MADPISGRLGALVHSGWIAVAPDTGRDSAFWLLTTPDSRAAVTMPVLAEALGLNPAVGSVTQVTSGLRLTVADGWARLEIGTERAERPVTAEWAQIAVGEGRAVLVIGYMPMPPGMDADTYIRQAMSSDGATIGLIPATGQ